MVSAWNQRPGTLVITALCHWHPLHIVWVYGHISMTFIFQILEQITPRADLCIRCLLLVGLWDLEYNFVLIGIPFAGANSGKFIWQGRKMTDGWSRVSAQRKTYRIWINLLQSSIRTGSLTKTGVKQLGINMDIWENENHVFSAAASLESGLKQLGVPQV